MKITKLGALVCGVALMAGCPAPDIKGDKKDENKGGSGQASGGGASGGGGGGGGAAAVDMRDYMQVMTPYPGWPKDASVLKPGLWVEMNMAGTGFKSKTRVSVVGEAGDSIKLEVGPDTNGYIQGLTVNKADGKVTAAVAAKKGEKPKAIKIAEMPKQGPAPEPTVTDEDVTVAAGTFKSKKSVVKVGGKDYTSWVGVDGDVKDVLLKSGEPAYELKAAPTMEDVKGMKAKHLVYSNGSEMWMVADYAPFYGAPTGTNVKSVNAGTTMEVSWGKDAKPELDWGK